MFKKILIVSLAFVSLVAYAKKEKTPLEEMLSAAGKGETQIVKMYIEEKGIDVNSPSEKLGVTALMRAAGSKNGLDTVKYLLSKGASVNAKDNNGSTAINFAATMGRLEIIQTLIEAGAEINNKTDSGSTPLHQATFWKHYFVIEYLIKSGADLAVKDNKGNTALDIARKAKKNENIINLFPAVQ